MIIEGNPGFDLGQLLHGFHSGDDEFVVLKSIVTFDTSKAIGGIQKADNNLLP